MKDVMRGAAILLLLAGCFPSGASSPSGPGGARYGFTGPTLELTINGLHFGPAAPDSSSSGQLVTTRDATTGRVTQSTLRVHASSAQSGAVCDLVADRFGDDIAPLGVGTYMVTPVQGTATPDGTVSPVAGESVSVPQGSWQCGACDGAVFGVTALASDHVDGYLSGTLDNTAGAAAATVVCSFSVPMR
jgi:hypothetical protein